MKFFLLCTCFGLAAASWIRTTTTTTTTTTEKPQLTNPPRQYRQQVNRCNKCNLPGVADIGRYATEPSDVYVPHILPITMETGCIKAKFTCGADEAYFGIGESNPATRIWSVIPATLKVGQEFEAFCNADGRWQTISSEVEYQFDSVACMTNERLVYGI